LIERSISDSRNAIDAAGFHHFSKAFPVESVPEVKSAWPSGASARSVSESPVEAVLPYADLLATDHCRIVPSALPEIRIWPLNATVCNGAACPANVARGVPSGIDQSFAV
jgi:hypothetical protein